ncbi:sensor domain-containing diguanylate cyclase [Agarivorans sp. TSD2052]|uniref:sensor domain-containing diguanylate cyclase n=1 Tax=Agarivorans sp. TSD2052 TaxID=2937286 RepID=UPI00200F1983|nr:sensor domain-containing diguanylate cyclase [Agarivorans sp. TSD2052]UPW17376.1 sensor domain-containing diguanylate cyclase [Agarivorans sp. TSD2052]
MDESDKIIAELREQNRQLKAQLNEAKNLLKISLDDSGLVLWEQDVPSGKLSLYNAEYGEICGISPSKQEALYENWKSNLHPEDRELAISAFDSMIQGDNDEYAIEYRMIHQDGSTRWIKDRGTIREYDTNNNPLRVIGTHIDVTQLRIDQHRLSKLAHQDTLTGLLNRHAFEGEFDNYCQSIGNQGGTLMFIDLDKFKPINDKYGHTAGDRILKACAEQIQSNCPEQGQTGRIGGDEFALLIPFSDPEKLEQLCKQLLASFSLPFKYNHIEVSVTLSIGMCSFHRHNEEFGEILHRADQAMYRVKHDGKNNYCLWGTDN